MDEQRHTWAGGEGGTDGRPPVQVTLLVPAKNEAESIPVLARELEAVMDSTGLAWECLWVDDGSTDGTLEALLKLRQHRCQHHFLSLDGNYGQSAALLAGFRAAAGEIIVTLDADLQNDPRDIPRLLEVLERGEAGMVNGVRRKRQDSRVRRISSSIANGFRNWVTRESVTDVGCSLRAFRADCVRDLPPFRGLHRFLPSFARLRGHRIVELPVGHGPRRFGVTKYGIHNRLWVGLVDTLGVRWLQSRYVHPNVRRSSIPELAGPPGALRRAHGRAAAAAGRSREPQTIAAGAPRGVSERGLGE